MDFKIKGNLRQGFWVIFSDGTIVTGFLSYTDAWNYITDFFMKGENK